MLVIYSGQWVDNSLLSLCIPTERRDTTVNGSQEGKGQCYKVSSEQGQDRCHKIWSGEIIYYEAMAICMTTFSTYVCNYQLRTIIIIR